MSEHAYDQKVTTAQRNWLREQHDDYLDDLMSECAAEPADFDNCLACAAYEIAQDREATSKGAESSTPQERLDQILKIVDPIVAEHDTVYYECFRRIQAIAGGE